ncbi:hypothetical protein D3C79_657440 [compost metagenome]
MNDLAGQGGLAGPWPVAQHPHGRELHLLALALGRGWPEAGVDHHRGTIAVRPFGTDLGIAQFGRGADTGQLDVLEVLHPVAIAGKGEQPAAHRHGVVAHQGGRRVLVVVVDMEH